MYKSCLLPGMIIVVLLSCRREMSSERALPPDDSGILFKRVDTSTEPGVVTIGVSTSVYEYNSKSRLVKQIFTAGSGGRSRSSQSRYTRDDKNRIISIEAESQELENGAPYETPEGPAFDTTVSNIVYQDEGSVKVSYIKAVTRSGERTFIDSTVYQYDSHAHVKRTTGYYLPWGIHQAGEAPVSSGYTEWTFSEDGSLTQIEQYAQTNGTANLQIRYRFEYDDKINPLFTKEDVFINNWFDVSPHNVVKQNVYIPVTNENYDNTAVYKYRSDNKPISVTYFSPPTVVRGERRSTLYYK